MIFEKLQIFISTLKRWPYFNVETTSVYQRWINVGIWRWNNVDFGVDSKKLLSFTIIQCLRTVTLNDICSDLICLRTVVFSWYFMKVSRKWSEEASIFSKLQVYENIHESFSFSITLRDDFCNHAILEIYSLMESCFMEIRTLLRVTLQKELLQVRFLGLSRTNILLRCI